MKTPSKVIQRPLMPVKSSVTWTVYPTRREDRIECMERHGTDVLYRGPYTELARAVARHTLVCARMPVTVARKLSDGSHIVQDHKPRPRRESSAVTV